MAVINQYERRVLPQGGIDTPRGATIGEAAGEGLQKLGQAGAGAAYDLARANEVVRQRQEKSDQQDATLKVLGFDTANDAALVDLQKQAKPGADGFVDTVKTDFDKRRAEFIKTIPDSAKPYAEEQLARVWGATQGGALRYQVTSRSNLDKKTATDIIDKGGASLVTNPGKLDFVRENVIASIKAMKLSPQDEAETLADVDTGLTTAALGGRVQQNAGGALAEINAGKWDSVGPEKLLQMRNVAESQVKADLAAARSAWREQQQIVKANTDANVSDYITSVRNNGGVPPMVNGQPLVTKEQVLKAHADDPVRGVYLVQQMEKSEQIGALTVQTKSTTLEEDQARLDAMSPKPGEVFTGDDADKLKAAQDIIADKWKRASEGVSADLKDFQNSQQEEYSRKAKDIAQTAFTTGEIPAGTQEMIYGAYGNTAQADAFWGDVKQSQALGDLNRKAIAGTLDEDNALYKQAAAEASAGGTGSAYAADQAKLLKGVLDDKYKALSESPAAFVVGDSGPLKSQWNAFAEAQKAAQAAPGDPVAANAALAAGKAASGATIAAQIKLGVPDYQAQAIPESLAKEYAYSLQTADPEKRPAIAQEIMNLGPSALGQVIKAGAPSSVAAYASVTNDPIWTNQLAQAEKLTGSDVDGILKTRNVKRSDLDDRVSGEFEKIAGTVPPSSQPMYRDSITNVAVMNVARGMPLGQAVTAAMAPFTRGSNISGSLRIPTDYSQPDTERGLQSVMAGIALGTVPVKAIPSGLPGATTETDLQAIKDAARNGGLSWMTNENSTGAILVLPTGRYLEGADGKRFEVPFTDAQAKGRTVPKVTSARPGYKAGVSQ